MSTAKHWKPYSCCCRAQGHKLNLNYSRSPLQRMDTEQLVKQPVARFMFIVVVVSNSLCTDVIKQGISSIQAPHRPPSGSGVQEEEQLFAWHLHCPPPLDYLHHPSLFTPHEVQMHLISQEAPPQHWERWYPSSTVFNISLSPVASTHCEFDLELITMPYCQHVAMVFILPLHGMIYSISPIL
ncbi:hypothetical protein PM082_004463 [Marasmius tenuissimus]|nr:hypothetical protein PM082_004463 [Marasmius tenuissimus]